MIALAVVFALAFFPAAAQAATIPVEITADELDAGLGADCSLREAVSTINDPGTPNPACDNVSADGFGDNDTVTLSAPTYTLTLDGTNEQANATGDLDMTRDLSIVGTGNPTINHAFGAGNEDRILHVPETDDDLSLTGLTVSGGEVLANSNVGGNILYEGGSNGQLTLNDVDVTNGVVNNPATGGFGGGIHSNGSVTIQNDSLIMDNKAGGAVGVTGRGAGINIAASDGVDLTVTDSEISFNDAALGGAGGGTSGFGGGVTFNVNTGSNAINLTNATIDTNRAAGGGSEGTGFGGGVHVQGGAGTYTFTMTGGSVTDNEAGGGAGGMTQAASDGFGGGLNLGTAGTASTALIDGVQVTGNKAGGNGGRADGDGGGIRTLTDLTVEDSNVSQNLVGTDPGQTEAPDLGGSGGGISVDFGMGADLTVTRTTINQNKAGDNTANGGGISMNNTGAMQISDSTITNNVAGETMAGGGNEGGGVFRFSGNASPVDSIVRTTISSNSVFGIGFDGTRGGGLAVHTQGTLTIDRSAITGNAATHVGNGDGYGGGVTLDSGMMGAGTFTVSNSTISDNTANSTTTYGGHGGGLATGLPGTPAVPEPTVTISHSTIASNTAVDGVSGGGSGGNLYANGAMDSLLLDLRASILANGVGDIGEENCAEKDGDPFPPTDVTGVIDSQGENVETTMPTQCQLDPMIGDQIGANPLLAALSPANGGDPANGIGTATRALMPGSPAIDSVPALGCPAVDQRGIGRPQGPACDAGAFEVFVAPPTPPTPPAPTPTAVPPAAVTENPECAVLRAKLRKAKSKRKKRKLRKRLRALGC